MLKSKFFLLWDPVTNRIVIDREHLKGHEVQAETEAKSWIEAKQIFGFELTPLQRERLNETNNRAQAGRRLLRDLKDARDELRVTDLSLQDGGKADADSGNGVQ